MPAQPGAVATGAAMRAQLEAVATGAARILSSDQDWGGGGGDWSSGDSNTSC